jgi:DNA mismatch repair protein MutS
MAEDITPIRQQYLDIKKDYPDTIVFFRLGDFYETFDQDAETTSRELDLVLTGRNVAKGTRVPMAGIPYHAVENYLARLIEKGYHVAICEQVGEQPSKGLFPRQVVRIVTPGTITEPSLLNADKNNYLLSYFFEGQSAAVACVDVSTGEFLATQFSSTDIQGALRAEIQRLDPSEVLVSDQLDPVPGTTSHYTRYPHWRYEAGRCQQILLSHFQVSTLEGFGIGKQPLIVRAAGALVQYIQDTQPAALHQLSGISQYSLDDFMILDTATRRNLELTATIRDGSRDGSLLGVLDVCQTSMGHRLLASWVNRPLLDISQINHRLDGVSFFIKDGLRRMEMRSALHQIADIERISTRISIGNVTPRELIALKDSILKLNVVEQIIQELGNVLDRYKSFDPCADVAGVISTCLDDEPPATINTVGLIRAGYSSELDQVIEASRHARDWIAGLESAERQRTGIKTLKVGFNKVFGYYLEITNANSQQAPSDYIRKQTLVNAERYITPELKEYETLVLNAESRIHEIEVRLFKALLMEIEHHGQRLISLSQMLAEVDAMAALADVAVARNYTRPVIDNGVGFAIKDGRHPVVESTLKAGQYIPNDIETEPGELIRIITGPNMSGKSTYLRQAALIVLMAQMGSFVPASSARIGLVDRIFTRIGAQDEIHSGQSTFMVEMVETANILHHATNRSLLILDEIGRGTSTYDGLSIAWAVIEYIHNHPRLRSRTFFATHYHEMIKLSTTYPGIRNFNVAVTESGDTVVFLHKIIPGGADKSYGIHVAQIAGIPQPVIVRANEILKELETQSRGGEQAESSSVQQMALFPETNPLLEEIQKLDINQLSPIDALNRLYEWQKKYSRGD